MTLMEAQGEGADVPGVSMEGDLETEVRHAIEETFKPEFTEGFPYGVEAFLRREIFNHVSGVMMLFDDPEDGDG